jgi:hypothetical protein
MKIFEENGKIRLQLMNLDTKTMLFDFTVEFNEFEELRDHVIASLKGFKI